MHRIKELRIAAGLSQKELAEKIDLTAHNIGDWEREKAEPSIYWLSKLANVFECSIDYLVGREDDFGVIQVSGQQPLTTLQQELLHYFDKMSDSQKNRLIGYAFAMVN